MFFSFFIEMCLFNCYIIVLKITIKIVHDKEANLLNEYFKYFFFLNKKTVQKLKIRYIRYISFGGRDFLGFFLLHLAQWSLPASWRTERSILLDTWHNCTPCCLVPCKFVIVFLFLNGKYRFSVQSLSLDFEYFARDSSDFLFYFLFYTLISLHGHETRKKKAWFLFSRQFLVSCFFLHKCWVIVCFEVHLFFL